jgi:hypothetical protein
MSYYQCPLCTGLFTAEAIHSHPCNNTSPQRHTFSLFPSVGGNVLPAGAASTFHHVNSFNQTAIGNHARPAAASCVMEEVPRTINLSPPASIPLSGTRSYYAGVAKPLKSVYGMICSTDCASVEQYLGLSKDNQREVKAYVPVDLTIAKFKVDTNRSRRDEYGHSQQKLSSEKYF